MSPIIPEIQFDDWARWDARAKLADELDVPESFGIFGLYLLAHSVGMPETSLGSKKHLSENVIYIGMSSHVDSRLENHHSKVAEYKTEYDDPSCKNLWLTTWMSDQTNDSKTQTYGRTYTSFLERLLILEYVEKFGNLPRFNKE